MAYRLPGSFSRHFRQIVSRSRGIDALSRRGGTGSAQDLKHDIHRGRGLKWRPSRHQGVERCAKSVHIRRGPHRARWPPACSGGMKLGVPMT